MSDTGEGKPSAQHLGAFALVAGTIAAERLAYYGMRSLLVLHLVQDLGLPHEQVAQIYGAFTGAIFVSPLLGGVLALFVPRKVLAAAGVGVSTLGFALVAAPVAPAVYLGLAVIVLGLSLYKGAVYAFAAELLPGVSDLTRLAAFVVLYASINIGALLSGGLAGSAQALGMSGAMLLAAGAGFLATALAILAIVVAPRTTGPAAPWRPLPFLGGLVLLVPTIPGAMLMEQVSVQFSEAARMQLPPEQQASFAALNPLTVILGGLVVSAVLFAARDALTRLTASHMMGAGLLVFALAALPLLGGERAPISLAMAAALTAVTAVAELLLFAALLSRLASAGLPRFGALAVAIQGITLYVGSWLAGPSQEPTVSVALVVLTALGGVALLALSGVLQRAFFSEDAVPAGDAAP